jgi:hypothetical protein
VRGSLCITALAILLSSVGCNRGAPRRTSEAETDKQKAIVETKPASPQKALPGPECPAGDRYSPLALPAEGQKPIEKWKGDLNGDGIADLLLLDGADCSNYGDCLHVLFLSCQSRWIPLWSAYAHAAEIKDAEETWKELEIAQREGAAAKTEAKRVRLRFDGTRYREVR